MDPEPTAEGGRLAARWSRYGRERLDRYLIQEVEHPTINAQSVLMRSFLVDRLHPGRFHDLIEEELYFSACASFALLGRREGWFPQLHLAIADPDPAVDSGLPGFLRADFRRQRARHFDVRELFDQLARCLVAGFDDLTSPFEALWRSALGEAGAAGPSRPGVLELACGSANDYRFWDRYGLADWIDYQGIDVCHDNIANARRRFPDVAFDTGDACRLALPDRSFDVVAVFDLYEHLSEEAMLEALTETSRVAGDELWLSLFNAAHVAEHLIQPADDYHWNLLSIPRLADELRLQGFDSQAVDVGVELSDRFPDYRHYNEQAHMLVAQRCDATPRQIPD